MTEPVEHTHDPVEHSHGTHRHRHGPLVHSHDDADLGPHDPGPHGHHLPEGLVARPDAIDPYTGTGCGHLGTDDGVARVVIRHRGREWVLCNDCAAAFDWEAADAAIDTLEAPAMEAEAGDGGPPD